MIPLFWLLMLLLPGPPRSAADVAKAAGADCRFGCIVGADGSAYALTWADVALLAKVAKAEAGPRFVEKESAATAWALVQGFYEVNRHRPAARRISLAQHIRNYSAVLGARWRTGSGKYHPRITPRADAYARIGWDNLPFVWRDFALRFVRGMVPNRLVGTIHVLARGFERSAAVWLLGPFYATTVAEHPGGNAYYGTADTASWCPWQVRIAPARFRRLP